MLLYDEYQRYWFESDVERDGIPSGDKQRLKLGDLLEQIYYGTRLLKSAELLAPDASPDDDLHALAWRKHEALFRRYVFPLATLIEESGGFPPELQRLGVRLAGNDWDVDPIGQLDFLEELMHSVTAVGPLAERSPQPTVNWLSEPWDPNEQKAKEERRKKSKQETKQEEKDKKRTKRAQLSRDLYGALDQWVDFTFPGELKDARIKKLIARESLFLYSLSELYPGGEPPPDEEASSKTSLHFMLPRWWAWFNHTNVTLERSRRIFWPEVRVAKGLLSRSEVDRRLSGILTLAVFSKEIHCRLGRGELEASAGDWAGAYKDLFDRLSKAIESLQQSGFAAAQGLGATLRNRRLYAERCPEKMGRGTAGRPPGGNGLGNNRGYWLWGEDTWQAVLGHLDEKDQRHGRLVAAMFGQPLARPDARSQSARKRTLNFYVLYDQLGVLVNGCNSSVVGDAHAASTSLSEWSDEVETHPQWAKLWRQYAQLSNGATPTRDWEDEDWKEKDWVVSWRAFWKVMHP